MGAGSDAARPLVADDQVGSDQTTSSLTANASGKGGGLAWQNGTVQPSAPLGPRIPRLLDSKWHNSPTEG
jgi:hypothetical protein